MKEEIWTKIPGEMGLPWRLIEATYFELVVEGRRAEIGGSALLIPEAVIVSFGARVTVAWRLLPSGTSANADY